MKLLTAAALLIAMVVSPFASWILKRLRLFAPVHSLGGKHHLKISRAPCAWHSLFQVNAQTRASGALVTFEPGSRTAWHSHPLGQILIVPWTYRETLLRLVDGPAA